MTISGVVSPTVTRRKLRDSLAILNRFSKPTAWILVAIVILLPCLCFLVLAVSPRLFDQGPQWFTLSAFQSVANGAMGAGLLNSIWVASAAAGFGLLVGFPLAWLARRTDLRGHRWVTGSMWLVFLLPSWLPSLGWERLVEPDGVMYRMGLHLPFVTSAIMGPFGVVLLLGLRCVPFTFLTTTAALSGLGQEFEDAARVHGAGRMEAFRLVAPILAPAIWSALAIGFAESVSDFGVASTLAYTSHFPLATFSLYQAIGNFPPEFSVAAAAAWLLIASVVIPLVLQAKALRGRSYAVLSGRTRPVTRRSLGRRGQLFGISFVGLFYFVALGIPAIGAVSGSLLGDYGANFQISFANYRAVFANSQLFAPLERSIIYALITATITLVGGFIAARMLAKSKTKATRFLDLLLLGAVALPGIVFAAGYIFAYNLPIFSKLGIDIYGTTTLLLIAYIATSLPTNARILVGSVAQLQASLHDAARAHGAGALRSWFQGVLPTISRPLLMAWLLTFCGIFLELPISQLLYAPGSPPVAITVQSNLGNYHFGVGMAQAVVAVVIAFCVVGLVFGVYRLLAPAGWRRIGGATHG